MIKDLLNKAIMENRKDWIKKRFSASDLGKCIRGRFYAVNSGRFPGKATSPRGAFRMYYGTVLQEEAEKLMPAGIIESTEVPLRDGLPLSGRLDWLMKIDGEKVIGEVKTLGYDPQLPDDNRVRLQWLKEKHLEYLFQTLYYMESTSSEYGIVICICFSGEIYDIYLRFSELAEEIEQMHANIDTLMTLDLSGDPPKRCGSKGKKECSYCPWADLCWADAKPEDFDINETDEELTLEYLSLKEKETTVKKELDELKEKVLIRLQQRKGIPIITSIGGMKLREYEKTSYTDIDKLRSILEPKGLFEEVLEVSCKRVKDLIELGVITADELEPAATKIKQTAIIQIKE